MEQSREKWSIRFSLLVVFAFGLVVTTHIDWVMNNLMGKHQFNIVARRQVRDNKVVRRIGLVPRYINV